ncbi:hypothetical protein HW555_005659 [Spodoptera exigua]|uniref:FLYWCH-type domain-containing protein n=1 Tax=Spodoptera exigua TaxID=7107 RepID=A0A835L766_SPOEX|nr:hypothetical protein HW555_005659 [Spodoptera exigua]
MKQPSTSKGELADFTLIKSKRGQDLLLRHGYIYNKRRENKNGVIVWRCIKRNECKAQLKTNIDCTVLINENPHLCQPSHIDNESKIKIDKCIKRAKTEPTISVPKIYLDMVSELKDSGLDLVKKIPNYDTVKKVLYASRNRALQVKKTRFNKVQDLVVPPCYDHLIFADFKDNETPIYALLPNKKENTYETFLNLIRVNYRNSPQNVLQQILKKVQCWPSKKPFQRHGSKVAYFILKDACGGKRNS